MKNIAITTFILLALVILGLLFVSFQVREIESALVTRFGEPVREITEPGWNFKWPPPIERVYKFDSRLKILDAELGETTTKGAVPIIVNTYVVWKISKPLEFFNAVGSVREAEEKLLGQIKDTQNKVIGLHYFSEFVNSDPAKIKFSQIQSEMFTSLKEAVKDDYGIDIMDLGIRQLKVNKETSKEVFERMRAERDSKTQSIITEGESMATQIKADADGISTELLAAAKGRAKAIRGQGDAEAAQYYKMLEADTELAMFLRDIEALKVILQARSTVVLSADDMPFRLLKELPVLTEEK